MDNQNENQLNPQQQADLEFQREFQAMTRLYSQESQQGQRVILDWFEQTIQDEERDRQTWEQTRQQIMNQQYQEQLSADLKSRQDQQYQYDEEVYPQSQVEFIQLIQQQLNDVFNNNQTIQACIFALRTNITSPSDIHSFRIALHDFFGDKSVRRGIHFGDVNLNTLFQDLSYLVSIQTPDIVVVDGNNVVISDLSLSESSLAYDQKVRKYTLLRTELMQQGYNVQIQPAIVDLQSERFDYRGQQLIFNQNVIPQLTRIVSEIWQTLKSDDSLQSIFVQYYELSSMNELQIDQVNDMPSFNLNNLRKYAEEYNIQGFFDQIISDQQMTSDECEETFLDISKSILIKFKTQHEKSPVINVDRHQIEMEKFQVEQQKAFDNYVQRSLQYGFERKQPKPICIYPAILMKQYDIFLDVDLKNRLYMTFNGFTPTGQVTGPRYILDCISDYMRDPIFASTYTKSDYDDDQQESEMVQNFSHFIPFSPRYDQSYRSVYQSFMYLGQKLRKQKHLQEQLESQTLQQCKESDPDWQSIIDPNYNTTTIDDFIYDQVQDAQYIFRNFQLRYPANDFGDVATTISDDLTNSFKQTKLYKYSQFISEVMYEVASNSARKNTRIGGFFCTVSKSGFIVVVDQLGQMRSGSKSSVTVLIPKQNLDFMDSIQDIFAPVVGDVEGFDGRSFLVLKPFLVGSDDLDVLMNLENTMLLLFQHVYLLSKPRQDNIGDQIQYTVTLLCYSFLLRVRNSNKISKEFQNSRHFVMKSLSVIENPYDVFSKCDPVTRNQLVLKFYDLIKDYIGKQKALSELKQIQFQTAILDEQISEITQKEKFQSIFTDYEISWDQVVTEIYICNSTSPDAFDKAQGQIKAIQKAIQSELKVPNDPEQIVQDLTGHPDQSVFEYQFNTRDDHMFCQRTVQSAAQSCFSSRQIQVRKGIKRGIQRAFMDVSMLTTFKSMTLAPCGITSKMPSEILNNLSYRDIMSNLQIYSQLNQSIPILSQYFREQGLVLSDTIIDVDQQEKRASVIEVVSKWISENPEHYNPVQILALTLDNQYVPFMDMFRKNQIGSVREIYIMNFNTRFSTFVSEKVSEGICQEMKEEMLTKGDKKIPILTNYIHKNMTEMIDTQALSLFETADQSQWGPNFYTTVFSSMYKALQKFLPKELYQLIQARFFSSLSKLIEIPREVTKQWNKYPTSDIGDLSINIVKSQTQQTGYPAFRNVSNMGQGIDHYTSSLLQVVFVHARYIIWDNLTNYLGYNYISKTVLSSDDRASADFIFSRQTFTVDTASEDRQQYVNWFRQLIVSGEGLTIGEHNIQFVQQYLYKYMTGALSNNFCIKYNSVKSVVSSYFIEFNSRFYFLTHSIEPSIKQLFRMPQIPQKISFKSSVEQSYSLCRAYVESGGYKPVSSTYHKIQKQLLERLYETNQGNMNDSSKMLNCQHQNLPYAFGCYPIMPSWCADTFGPRYHDFIQSQECQVTRCLINGMCKYQFDQLIDDESGPMNYPKFRLFRSSKINRSRKYITKNRVGWMPQNNEENNPYLLVDKPTSSYSRHLYLFKKIMTFGAQEAFDIPGLHLVLSRIRSQTSKKQLTLPNSDDKYTWLEAIQKIYQDGDPTKVELNKYADTFYFRFKQQYKHVMSLKTYRPNQSTQRYKFNSTIKASINFQTAENILLVPGQICIKSLRNEEVDYEMYSLNTLERSKAIMRSCIPNIDELVNNPNIQIVQTNIPQVLQFFQQKMQLSQQICSRIPRNEIGNMSSLMMDQIDGCEMLVVNQSLVENPENDRFLFQQLCEFWKLFIQRGVYTKQQFAILADSFMISVKELTLRQIIDRIISRSIHRVNYETQVLTIITMITLQYSSTDIAKFVGLCRSPRREYIQVFRNYNLQVTQISDATRQSAVFQIQGQSEYLPIFQQIHSRDEFSKLYGRNPKFMNIPDDLNQQLQYERSQFVYIKDQGVKFYGNVTNEEKSNQVILYQLTKQITKKQGKSYHQSDYRFIQQEGKNVNLTIQVFRTTQSGEEQILNQTQLLPMPSKLSNIKQVKYLNMDAFDKSVFAYHDIYSQDSFSPAVASQSFQTLQQGFDSTQILDLNISNKEFDMGCLEALRGVVQFNQLEEAHPQVENVTYSEVTTTMPTTDLLSFHDHMEEVQEILGNVQTIDDSAFSESFHLFDLMQSHFPRKKMLQSPLYVNQQVYLAQKMCKLFGIDVFNQTCIQQDQFDIIVLCLTGIIRGHINQYGNWVNIPPYRRRTINSLLYCLQIIVNSFQLSGERFVRNAMNMRSLRIRSEVVKDFIFTRQTVLQEDIGFVLHANQDIQNMTQQIDNMNLQLLKVLLNHFQNDMDSLQYIRSITRVGSAHGTIVNSYILRNQERHDFDSQDFKAWII